MLIADVWLLSGAAVLIFAGALVGGFIAGIIFQIFYHKSLVRGEASKRGIEAKVEKTERMNAALVEAAQLLQDGKKPEEIVKLLLPKYPDVALDLVKKLSGRGLGGLLGASEPV